MVRAMARDRVMAILAAATLVAGCLGAAPASPPLSPEPAPTATPPAVGNRVAAAVLADGLTDGSNEAGGYANPAYVPVNDPLVIAHGATTMVDPNRWQPLQMAQAVSQNGLAATSLQKAIGTQW